MTSVAENAEISLAPRGRSMDAPSRIDHADAGPFQRHVDPGMMLHGCPSRMLGADPFGPVHIITLRDSRPA